MASKFKVGDLVWAKMKGFPIWPGKVIEPKPDIKPPHNKIKRQFVFFYGSENFAWVPEESIFHYVWNRDKYMPTSRIPKGFKEAVDSIEEVVKTMPDPGPEPEDLPTIDDEIAQIFPGSSPPKEKRKSRKSGDKKIKTPRRTPKTDSKSAKKMSATSVKTGDEIFNVSSTKLSDPATEVRVEVVEEGGNVVVKSTTTHLAKEKVPKMKIPSTKKKIDSSVDKKVTMNRKGRGKSKTGTKKESTPRQGSSSVKKSNSSSPKVLKVGSRKRQADSLVDKTVSVVSKRSSGSKAEDKNESTIEPAASTVKMSKSSHNAERIKLQTELIIDEMNKIINMEQNILDEYDTSSDVIEPMLSSSTGFVTMESRGNTCTDDCKQLQSSDMPELERVVTPIPFTKADRNITQREDGTENKSSDDVVASTKKNSKTRKPKNSRKRSHSHNRDTKKNARQINKGKTRSFVSTAVEESGEVPNDVSVSKGAQVGSENKKPLAEARGKDQHEIRVQPPTNKPKRSTKGTKAQAKHVVLDVTKIGVSKSQNVKKSGESPSTALTIKKVNSYGENSAVAPNSDVSMTLNDNGDLEKKMKKYRVKTKGRSTRTTVGAGVAETFTAIKNARVEKRVLFNTPKKDEKKIRRQTKDGSTPKSANRKRSLESTMSPAAKKAKLLVKMAYNSPSKTKYSSKKSQETVPTSNPNSPGDGKELEYSDYMKGILEGKDRDTGLGFDSISPLHGDTASTKETIIATPARIGFLGLGIMGTGMVNNLLRSGHEVTVWNRTPAKCREFVKEGALKANSPAEVVQMCDITFSCVSDPTALKDLVFGNCGVLQGIGPGKSYVDMSTVDTETITDIHEAVTARGGRFLEAPVIGSRQPSSDGQLILLASGDQSLFKDCYTSFQAMGKRTFFLGEIGSATKMKLVINLLMGTIVAGLAESLALAEKVGLDQEEVMSILDLSAVACSLIRNKGSAMMHSKYSDPQCKLQLYQKDLRLAVNLSDSVEQPLHVGSAVNELFKKAKAKGYGEHDTAAVYRAADL